MEAKPYAPIDLKTKESILKSIDKSVEHLAAAVQMVKEWLGTQERFPEQPSDSMIEFFIVITEFDLDAIKEKLNCYYSIRTEIPEVFALSYPLSPSMIDTLDFTQVYPLPKLVNNSEGCILIRLKNPTVPEGFDANSWLAATVNVFEVLMQQTVLLNNNVIYDHKHLSLTHIFYITPKFITNCATILDKVFSDKVKIIHVINYPSIFQIVLTLCKPIIKPELYARIRLHESLESLTKDIPLDVLPKEYGGNEKSLEDLEWAWKETLYDNKKRFEELQNLKLDNVAAPKQPEGLFNSFSKLLFN